MTRAFGFVTSVAAKEATGDALGDDNGGILAFYHLEAETAFLASTVDLFLNETPPLVSTILKFFKRIEQRKKNNGGFGMRGKEEKIKMKLGLEHF